MKFVLAILGFLSGVGAVNAELLAARKVSNDPNMNFWELYVTAETDSVRILSIDVNRGCKRGGGVPFPIDLKFGQEVWLGTMLCEPIEVRISTPEGPQTLSWDLDVNGQLSAQKFRIPTVFSGNDYFPANVSWNWLTFVINTGDDVKIDDFILNRGNCRFAQNVPVPETANNPSTLKFGQRFAILSSDCNPLELLLDTSAGQVDFSWDE